MKQEITEKKGMGLMDVMTGFVIVAAILFLVVMLIFVFGSISLGLESTAVSNSVTNESDSNGNIAFLNSTTYLTRGLSSTGTPRTFSAVSVWGDGNQSQGFQANVSRTPTGYTILLPAANYSLSSVGVFTTAGSFVYPNVSASYTYKNDSVSQTAASDAQDNTSRAVPLIGILFIIIAVATIITLLMVSLLGRKKA